MKIVVQNGTQHCLSRQEIEAMVLLFPAPWSSNVKVILLGTKNETGITINFHPKEQCLYLACSSKGTLPSKIDAIEELLIALVTIEETGFLPKKISSAIKSHALEITSELAQSCIKLVESTNTLNSISSETKTP
ncbi:MAG: hypothetical protein NVSMB40_12640 [Aquirhabdus sp.]